MNTMFDRLRNQEPGEIKAIKLRISNASSMQQKFPLILPDDIKSLDRLDMTLRNHLLASFFNEIDTVRKLEESFFNFKRSLGSNMASIEKIDEMILYIQSNFPRLKPRVFLEKLSNTRNSILYELADSEIKKTDLNAAVFYANKMTTSTFKVMIDKSINFELSQMYKSVDTLPA